MRSASIVSAAFIVAVGCAFRSSTFSGAPSVAANPCLGPDRYSDYHVQRLQRITGATTPSLVKWREIVKLPAVPASEVVFVSDSATCARGVTAYNGRANLEAGEVATAVYVIRVGDLFVVSNPQFTTGEFVAQFVFDSTFALRSVYLQ